ncbi:SpvB/TcaC N-terminal domain-containing protein, partial [Acinetobacter baumannii]
PALPDVAYAGTGSLPGSASTDGGAAGYHVPIEVPPGRSGMQPGVSLGYSSKSGNGPLGMGWSLSTGSSIARCPQTLAQDGQPRPVSYSASD